MPRQPPPSDVFDLRVIHDAVGALGLTETSASVEYVLFAYLAQCRCDPAGTRAYFDALWALVQQQQARGEVPAADLQALVLEERARGRFSTEDLERHVRALGFGEHEGAWLEYEPGGDDRVVEEAYRFMSRAAWAEDGAGEERQRELDEALGVLAQARGSRALWERWRAQGEGGGRMGPAKAYQTLEIAQDTDEDMILMVFSLRVSAGGVGVGWCVDGRLQVEDQPGQAEKMRQALRAIAEQRDSERLLRFAETGVDRECCVFMRDLLTGLLFSGANHRAEAP